MEPGASCSQCSIALYCKVSAHGLGRGGKDFNAGGSAQCSSRRCAAGLLGLAGSPVPRLDRPPTHQEECQRAAWKRHRTACRAVVAAKQRAREKQNASLSRQGTSAAAEGKANGGRWSSEKAARRCVHCMGPVVAPVNLPCGHSYVSYHPTSLLPPAGASPPTYQPISHLIVGTAGRALSS